MTTNDNKRQRMSAIAHRETKTQIRPFQRVASHAAPVAASLNLVPQEAKQFAMSAIANVQSVGRVGWIPVAGAAAVYLAHIRQMDRQNGGGPRSRKPRKITDKFGREHYA